MQNVFFAKLRIVKNPGLDNIHKTHTRKDKIQNLIVPSHSGLCTISSANKLHKCAWQMISIIHKYNADVYDYPK